MAAAFNFCTPSSLIDIKKEISSQWRKPIRFSELQPFLLSKGRLKLVQRDETIFSARHIQQFCYCANKKCRADPAQCLATIVPAQTLMKETDYVDEQRRIVVWSVHKDIAISKADLGQVRCKRRNSYHDKPALYGFRRLCVRSHKIKSAPRCVVQFDDRSEEIFSLGEGRHFITDAVV